MEQEYIVRARKALKAYRREPVYRCLASAGCPNPVPTYGDLCGVHRHNGLWRRWEVWLMEQHLSSKDLAVFEMLCFDRKTPVNLGELVAEVKLLRD